MCCKDSYPTGIRYPS
ncbi:unnamed protein product [Victoria cruziana]